MITCKECNGACCRYVTVTLDNPEDKEDWDHIKWLVAHKNVIVYQDNDGDWLAEFQTPCEYLGPKNECLCYENRPDICREHGMDECIINGEGEVSQIQFDCIEDVENYMKIKYKNKKL